MLAAGRRSPAEFRVLAAQSMEKKKKKLLCDWDKVSLKTGQSDNLASTEGSLLVLI